VRPCQLCGSTENVKVYCGGPAAFMCDRCRDIVYEWERLKKVRAEIFRKRKTETQKLEDQKDAEV